MKNFLWIILLFLFSIGIIMTYWKLLIGVAIVGGLIYLFFIKEPKRQDQPQYRPYAPPATPIALNPGAEYPYRQPPVSITVNDQPYVPNNKPRFVRFKAFTGDEYTTHKFLDDFIAIDFETANEQPKSICAVGLTEVRNRQVISTNSWYVRPRELRFSNSHIHGITEDMVEDHPTFDQLWETTFRNIISDKVVAAYNANFDIGCLEHVLQDYGIAPPRYIVADVLPMARYCWSREFENFKLSPVSANLGIPLNHHNAGSDAEACARVLLAAQECNIMVELKFMRMKYPDPALDKAMATAMTPEIDTETALNALALAEAQLPCQAMTTYELSALHRKMAETYFSFNHFIKTVEHCKIALEYDAQAGVKRLLKKAEKAVEGT